ncbi:MAG: M81 family metallopeptidase [Litorilinea sp.]
MRIVIAEVGQETCSFSPVRTTVDTFRQYGLYEGQEVLDRRRGRPNAVAGFLQAAEEEGLELDLVPIISAWAGASGPLTDDTLAFFRTKIEDGLRAAGDFDAVFLSLHGAAAAESEPDVEGDLIAATRAIIGPDIPIVTPLDHHANVTRRMIDLVDGLVGHRTQPHDPFDTGEQAAHLLFAILRGDVRPTIADHKIPMFTHQEQFLTSRGPMKRWFDRAREMEQMPGVASVSNFPIQPWLDVPEGGWTTVVITHDDPELAQRLSAELAQMAWDLREEFWVYESIPVADAVEKALRAPKGLVLLSDTGDSVFGGATGDSNLILRELVERQVDQRALLTMVDPEAAQMAWAAGEGAEITTTLGGKRAGQFGAPFSVTARVAMRAEGLVEANAIGRHSFDMGKTALLEIGEIRVVVSENVGLGSNHPAVFRRYGLEPAEAKMLVMKTASNFQYYADMTSEIIRVDTQGPTMSHLEDFPWQLIPRPTYPFDALPEWSARAETS